MSDATCSVTDCPHPPRLAGMCGAHHQRKLRHGDPLYGGPLKVSAGDRVRYFYANLYSVTEDCKVWQYAASRNYGVIQIQGRQYRVHSLACLAWNGPPPPGRTHAAHGRDRRCESTLCFNGAHLSWKPPWENSRDMTRDGTNPAGERNPAALLNATAVLEIRNRYRVERVRQQDLAVEYGVDQTTVSEILRGTSWGHLPGAQPSRERMTETQIAAIRAAVHAGETQRCVAARYGVSTASVSLWMNNKRRRTKG